MTTLYDAFPYRARPVPEAHVDRLFLVAHLFGVSPAPVGACRVLEIGCADGGHLVPMAEALPGSTFVGIDLSARQVADGQAWVQPLGLVNLELRHGDALGLRGEFFDYVICHGVYSWIPAPQRAQLLRTVSELLAPGGVAYISYNTYPGWHTRQIVRDFVLQHAVETDEPEERVAAAQSMLRFLHGASDPDAAHGRLIQEQCASILSTSPQYLLHGLLAEVNDPCTFLDFVEAVQGAGLDYLGDAELGSMTGASLHEAGQREMASVPGGLIAHEQVQDYLAHRSFRRSLLVRSGTALQRSIPWSRVEGLWVSARATRLRAEADGVTRYDVAGAGFETSDPMWQAGLDHLGACWPATVSMGDWVAAVAQRVGAPEDAVRGTLGRQVLSLHSRGVLQLHPRDLQIARGGGTRPRVTAWARRQIALGQPVTDRRHVHRTLPADLQRVASGCDGTRDLSALSALVDADAARAQRALEGLGTRSMLGPEGR